METFVKRFKRQIKLMEKFSKLETAVKNSDRGIRFVQGPEISTIAQHRVLYYDVRYGRVTIGRISPLNIKNEWGYA